MTSHELRQKFLEFFEEKGHKRTPSASLVPENDPTSLFTSSGMQPMIEYFLGKNHPKGSRIVNSQRCLRSQDIEEVGDNRHTTFFEMLGNWSFGDYFKKEQLSWFFEFLTQELGLDPKRLYITAFSGDEKNRIPKDTETAEIWKNIFQKHSIEAKDVCLVSEENAVKVGMQGGRIFYYYEKNWWSRSGAPNEMPAGEPGGPDSEVFYEFEDIEHDPRYGDLCHPNCDCGRFLEIGNSVFMQYQKQADGSFKELPKKNVDFGGGFERQLAVLGNHSDVFKTDLFMPIIKKIEELTSSSVILTSPSVIPASSSVIPAEAGIQKGLEEVSGKKYEGNKQEFRIIADHLRAAVFAIDDGVLPSNKEAGYVVRRLIRRAVVKGHQLGINENFTADFVGVIAKIYDGVYELKTDKIKKELQSEEEKFRKTLSLGLKEFGKIISGKKEVSGKEAFDLYQTYGFPAEMTVELAGEKGIIVDEKGFHEEFKKHQELSRSASAGMFKGGLADSGEMATKYHTATHLLHAALRQVLGDHVEQKGSNITAERMRFDFSHDEKMTDEEKKKVEDMVNEQIAKKLPVTKEEMTVEEARKSGAIGVFGEKHGEKVLVYTIGNPSTRETRSGSREFFSREICGGPHAKNTGELGHFRIKKEESSSKGVRRIKAVLED